MLCRHLGGGQRRNCHGPQHGRICPLPRACQAPRAVPTALPAQLQRSPQPCQRSFRLGCLVPVNSTAFTFLSRGHGMGARQGLECPQIDTVIYVLIWHRCIHKFIRFIGKHFLLAFCCIFFICNRTPLVILRSFTRLCRLKNRPHQFNEFVTNGPETAPGPEKIKKFLANLRPTNRKHSAAQAGSALNAINGKQHTEWIGHL